MGNSCFCTTNNFFNNPRINICFENDSMIGITEKVLSKGDTDNQKQEVGINKLRKYFDESDNLIEKEKLRKYMFRKKRETILGTTIDIKYEIMLKRLLDQKSIKRKGPKRRKTIRSDENEIKKIIDEVIKENKNEKKNSNNKPEEEKASKVITILKGKTDDKKESEDEKKIKQEKLIKLINKRILDYKNKK